MVANRSLLPRGQMTKHTFLAKAVHAVALRDVFARSMVSTVMLTGLAGSACTVQAQDTNATIVGTVTDASGAAVAKAEVTVTNTQTNNSSTVQTADSGAFTVPQLLPGILMLIL